MRGVPSPHDTRPRICYRCVLFHADYRAITLSPAPSSAASLASSFLASKGAGGKKEYMPLFRNCRQHSQVIFLPSRLAGKSVRSSQSCWRSVSILALSARGFALRVVRNLLHSAALCLR